MAKATGFVHDNDTGDIRMNAGDTGSFWLRATRSSGESWPDTARMLYTIRNPLGVIVLQRIYRLDDQWDQGDGVVLIEFHNDDTDTWDAGNYEVERRYDITPVWEGTPSASRCVDQLGPGTHAVMKEGDVVRTVFKGTLTIEGVIGTI